MRGATKPVAHATGKGCFGPPGRSHGASGARAITQRKSNNAPARSIQFPVATGDDYGGPLGQIIGKYPACRTSPSQAKPSHQRLGLFLLLPDESTCGLERRRGKRFVVFGRLTMFRIVAGLIEVGELRL